MIKLQIPLNKDEIIKLKIGDEVQLSGTIVTGRDQAHKLMIDEKPGFIREYLKDSVIYHCGPVVRQNQNGNWEFVSAGPTTSAREEPYQADVIKEYGIRGVIGKGGMGEKTLRGLNSSGAVYFHAIGGAGALIANSVTKVIKVFKLEEFGTPEAFWVIEVKDLPLIVTMDANLNSIHQKIKTESAKIASELNKLKL
jgi:fumarate hydratase class I